MRDGHLDAPPVHYPTSLTPPRKLRNASPLYPPAAQTARVQGVVILEVTLDCTGAVEDARVIRSLPLLDDAALDAVRQWRYAPTVHDGKRVPIVMTVTVNFTLQS